MLAFGGLVTWLALTKLVVVRVLAAFLAFLPAAVFGIAVVNKYYDYYQTWGALFSDCHRVGRAGSSRSSRSRAARGPAGHAGAAIAKSANTALVRAIGFPLPHDGDRADTAT